MLADNVLNVTAADNQTIVLTGAQNTTLTASTAIGGGVTGFNIDASAFTGKATLTGTAATDIIKGGSGADTLNGGAGAISDTFTGGSGADKFVTESGATAATADVITDFVSTSDTISFLGGIAGTAANYTEGAAPVADFAAALAAANTALAAGTVDYNVQQVGSDSWIFTDNGTGVVTQVIELTGVTLAGIQFSDIVL